MNIGSSSTKHRPRNQKIFEMRSRGLCLQEIGDQFGITKERVRQLLKLSNIPNRFATVPDLARRFGTSQALVRQAARAAGLKAGSGKNMRVANKEIDRVERQLKALTRRTCIVCGKQFNRTGTGTRTRCFSEECRRQRRKQTSWSFPTEGRASERTMAIVDLLRKEAPGRAYVPLKDALHLTGMTQMQLTGLRQRSVIACIPSGRMHGPTGRPLWLYSKRHCALIRSFLEQKSSLRSHHRS